LGNENYKKRELENYAKKDPEFAAKIKLLEELKAQKEKEKQQENAEPKKQ
jgi:hypothetical protein